MNASLGGLVTALGLAATLSQPILAQNNNAEKNYQSKTQVTSGRDYDLSGLVNKASLLEFQLRYSEPPVRNAPSYIGKLLFGDISKLASRYELTVGYDGLSVSAVGEQIVVQYEIPQRVNVTLTFSQDDTVIEETLDWNASRLLPMNGRTLTRISILYINGKKIVQRDPVSLMDDYNFVSVYSRILELKKQRRISEYDYTKYRYASNQLEIIAHDLFKRYGIDPRDHGVGIDTFAANDILTLHANALYWEVALDIKNKDDAELTIIRKIIGDSTWKRRSLTVKPTTKILDIVELWDLLDQP